MFGERVTTEISQQEKHDTFVKNKKSGRPIVSRENYLLKSEVIKRLKQ